MRLVKIEEFCHLDENKNIIYKENNINNIFHNQGQEFCLSILFSTSLGIEVPSNYFLGLDDREFLLTTDTLSSLINEPLASTGYSRQPVSSFNGFSIEFNNDDQVWQMSSGILIFSTTTGFGPIKNVFLTNVSDGTGYLISSASLSIPRTLSAGQSFSLRFSTSLGNCS